MHIFSSVFHREVLESLQRGAAEGVNENNLVLEVNSSRHAYAVTAKQVIHSVVTSVLTIAEASAAAKAGKGQPGLVAEAAKQIKAFRGLMLKYIKARPAQYDCLVAAATFCRCRPDAFVPVFAKVVHCLYEADVVSEEAILAWFDDPALDGSLIEHLRVDEEEDEQGGGETADILRAKLKPLVKWLKETESSSDDDNGSGSDTEGESSD